MTYKILPYSYEQAEKLGVTIKPSKKKNKKIDVYKNGDLIASIGDIHYFDYPNYLLQNETIANTKTKLYKIRHEKDRHKINSPGFFADKILW
jgi:hypothetical protein